MSIRSRLKATRAELDRVVRTDPVTALASRAAFTEHLDEVGGVAVVVLALGGVDDVEDSLGYAWTDALRAELAARLLAVAPAESLTARLEGERFAVAIARGTSASAHAFASRAILSLARPVHLAGIDVSCTATAGIAVGEAPGAGVELLQRAAVACRTATRPGAAPVAEFDPASAVLAAGRLALAHELRRAVTNEEMEVHYQPVVSLADGRVVGAEALVRWNHPTAGVLLPAAWLDVAISCGAMSEIGAATLGVSCRRFATLNAARETPLRVSVNLSLAELRAEGAATRVADRLDTSGLDPSLLTIEVPEDAFVETTTASTLAEISALGVGIAIDDFGTANSSLLELRRFDVDYLKLDGAFVAGAAEHPVDAAVVEATCALARSLDARVVAEGVTTEGAAELLRDAGCQYAQGWLYGPAVPFARLVEFLRRSGAGEVSPATSVRQR